MPIPYAVIEVFTSEKPGWKSKSVSSAIVDLVASLKIPARSAVFRGSSGSFETGEIVSTALEVLSFQVPVKIEIILPENHLAATLSLVEALVLDGVILVRRADASLHRVESRLVPRHLLVGDVMTRNPVSIDPEFSVSRALTILLESPFHALPVVDKKGRPAGMLTQGDLIRKAGLPFRFGLLPHLEEGSARALMNALETKKTREVMTSPAVTVTESQPLREAVRLLLDRGLKRMPVTGEDGKLTGMLARLDVFRTVSLLAPDWKKFREENVRVAGVRFVRDVMQDSMETVPPEAPVEEVLRRLASSGSQRLAVTGKDGELLGIVSDRDVFSRFAEARQSLLTTAAEKLGIHRTRIPWESKQHGLATAERVMTPNPVWVSPETPIQEAFQIMLDRGLKRLPVVDENRRLIGMISRDALLRCAMACESEG